MRYGASWGCDSASGQDTLNSTPPSTLRAAMQPPMLSSMIIFDMYSPMPLPPSLAARVQLRFLISTSTEMLSKPDNNLLGARFGGNR